MDKRFSLLRNFTNYGRKTFRNIGPRKEQEEVSTSEEEIPEEIQSDVGHPTVTLEAEKSAAKKKTKVGAADPDKKKTRDECYKTFYGRKLLIYGQKVY
jgi:hypothetical protein